MKDKNRNECLMPKCALLKRRWLTWTQLPKKMNDSWCDETKGFLNMKKRRGTAPRPFERNGFWFDWQPQNDCWKTAAAGGQFLTNVFTIGIFLQQYEGKLKVWTIYPPFFLSCRPHAFNRDDYLYNISSIVVENDKALKSYIYEEILGTDGDEVDL